LVVGLLTGCNRSEPEAANPTPPPAVTQKPVERVELMPDTSDEYLRRHYIDANGFEVETRIEYRNGDKATIKFRSDKTQESYKRVAKNGSVLIEQNYAADGKTIVSGQELRADGTMKWKATQDAAGTVTTVTYWWDGKSVFSEKKQQMPSGAHETTYFRKDGSTVWMKKSGPTSGVVTKELQYGSDGKLQFMREKSATSIDVVTTFYRADGTAEYKQYTTERPSGYGNYTYRTLAYVEELAADGKTVVRKLHMNSSGYTVVKVERPNADGTVTVREVSYGGDVTREEKRDASGNVLDSKDYKPSDGVKESWDSRATREPYLDDPVNQWDYAERWPQYRR
jgi:hypothetical protein